jgi:hypothetical protein
VGLGLLSAIHAAVGSISVIELFLWFVRSGFVKADIRCQLSFSVFLISRPIHRPPFASPSFDVPSVMSRRDPRPLDQRRPTPGGLTRPLAGTNSLTCAKILRLIFVALDCCQVRAWRLNILYVCGSLIFSLASACFSVLAARKRLVINSRILSSSPGSQVRDMSADAMKAIFTSGYCLRSCSVYLSFFACSTLCFSSSRLSCLSPFISVFLA